MDSETNLEYYKMFCKKCEELDYVYKKVERYDFLEGLSVNMRESVKMCFRDIGSDDLREIGNVAGSFGYYLHEIRAWNEILKELNDSEKIEILFEFVDPLLHYCLFLPYAYKNQLLHSICQLTALANEHPDSMKAFSEKMGKATIDNANAYAKNWTSWPKLKSSLKKLGNEAFRDATRDYRHSYNHRTSINIEVGLKSRTQWKAENGRISITHGVENPVPLINAIDALTKQQAFVIAAYDSYAALIKEEYMHLFETK